MGKPRTKRQQLREERKQKRKAQQETNLEAKHDKKRRRTEEDEEADQEGGDQPSYEFDEPSAKRHDDGASHPDGPERPEREFFGMLDDDEQEYFKRADELLELNDFPSEEERDFFLQNVYREAVGKELKLASSQSLSRLMERLILLSTPRQKKHIFTAFAGHFMSLVQHRFASHCCEALFLQSAPVVTQELGGGGAAAFVVDTKGGEDGEEPENSMENLFLLTLDELEEHLSFLLTDRFASHTLRVLLIVLSGRPLEDSSTRTLLKSKKKERITVQGHAGDSQTQLRAVPGSFTMATKKIIQDTMRDMDFTSLRVLAKHPTGNPLLQLLLELDIALNHKEKNTDPNATLLYKLLPDAPASLSNPESEACDLFNSLIYDPIGSRLLETLITHCPGRVFKPLHANILGPRIATYVRNDVASYAALRALNRFSKDDLVPAVEKIIPIMPVLVSKARYNVIKTLYERCTARGAPEQIPYITRALTTALGSNSKELVPKLCGVEDASAAAGKEEKPKFQQDAQNKSAMAAHGAHLVAAMLSTPGIPSKVAQNSLLALSPDQLFTLATHTAASANVLTTALSQPSPNNAFHKAIVAALVPRTAELALNSYGHRILEAIPALPSRGPGSVPFHVKQTIMSALAAREHDLRESWTGRSTWRAWRGDVHKTRPYDWTSWAKEVDAPVEGGDDAAPVEVKLKPWQKMALKKKEAEARAKEGGAEPVGKDGEA